MIPLVRILQRSTASHECQGSKLATELSAQCHKRFSSIESFYGLAVSTYLDTRFKNVGFRDMANVDAVKKQLITEIQSVNQTPAPSFSAPEPSTSSATSFVSAMAPATTSSTTEGVFPSPPTTKSGIWTEFDSQVLASQEHRTTGTDAFIEMRRYSEEKPIPQDGDPLLWWKTNEPTFPSLSKLSKKHLEVIAMYLYKGFSLRQEN